MKSVEVDVLGKSAVITSLRPLAKREVTAALASHPEYFVFSFRPVPMEGERASRLTPVYRDPNARD